MPIKPDEAANLAAKAATLAAKIKQSLADNGKLDVLEILELAAAAMDLARVAIRDVVD